ncbi:hypothetical protein AB835_05160 [Candidatus Endobugula sertula]|uniref:DUF2059 domain-containing protein n=1 Tax=Candidatus Endobugula sertula TaxID=62101 RepID=A0A1D2QRA6_9GAMM|nr:hypothetical protein AB835_05160 [Candidatus Endobugula sertula]
MIKKLLITLIYCISLNVIAAESIEKISQEKKQAIDEVLTITGSLTVTDLMSNDIAQQMVDGLYHRQWSLQPEIITTIRDEIKQIMYDEFIANGLMKSIVYVIYDKHFSLQELQEIVIFYKTPTGKKLITVLPQVTQEALSEGRRYGQRLVPLIQERMKKRFEKLELQ